MYRDYNNTGEQQHIFLKVLMIIISSTNYQNKEKKIGHPKDYHKKTDGVLHLELSRFPFGEIEHAQHPTSNSAD